MPTHATIWPVPGARLVGDAVEVARGARKMVEHARSDR